MSKVTKRDGTVVDYNIEKIENAIAKALVATQEVRTSLISRTARTVAVNVESALIEKYGTEDFQAGVEEIQDLVEKELMNQGYQDTAKAYILYRDNHEKLRNQEKAKFDVTHYIEQFIGMNAKGEHLDKDWRTKENSTVGVTLGGLILSNSGTMTSNYWLNEIYDKDIKDAHDNCFIHIHDLSMLSAYCSGWNLKQLIQEGLGGVEGKITSAPAKHLSTLCNQMVNFLGILQNEAAGAQAFSSFDTYLAPFVKADNLSYKETKQAIQSFLYGVNTPSRWGTQAPFTNVTIDWTVPEDLADLPAIVGGKEMDFCYKDCQKEMDMINKAFIELMIEGDYNGRGYQYPMCKRPKIEHFRIA